MHFKLSKYITVSAPLDQDDAPGSLRMIFSTRKGMGITLTNYVWALVQAGNISQLPDHLFNILMFHEMIIPAEEDELEEIIARKSCMAGDARRREVGVTIDVRSITDSVFIRDFRARVQALANAQDDIFRKTLTVTVPDAGGSHMLRVAQFVDTLMEAHGLGDAVDVVFSLIFGPMPTVEETAWCRAILPRVARVVLAFDYRVDDIRQLQQFIEQPEWQGIPIDIRIFWKDDPAAFRALAAPLKAMAACKNVRIYPVPADEERSAEEASLLRFLRGLDLPLNLLPAASYTYSRRHGTNHVPVEEYRPDSFLFAPSNAAVRTDLHVYDDAMAAQLRMHAIACSACTYLPMCGGQFDKGPEEDSCPVFIHNFDEKVRLKYALAPGVL